MHYCGICFQKDWDHTSACYFGEEEGVHHHFPALCCPGCLCESWEEAHPEHKHDWQLTETEGHYECQSGCEGYRYEYPDYL